MKSISKLPFSRGDGMVLLAMAMFGTYPLFLRFFSSIPFLYFLFAFQIIGFLGFGLATKREHKAVPFNPRLMRLFFLFAAVAVLNDVCYFWGFRLTLVANVAFAHQMVSVFLLFLALRFLGEKVRKNEWTALVVALIGIALIYGGGLSFGRNDLLGITLGLAGFFYACVILFYRYLPSRGLTNARINAWRYGLGIFLVLPFVNDLGGKALTWADVGALLFFGLFFAVIGVRIHSIAMGVKQATSCFDHRQERARFCCFAWFFVSWRNPDVFSYLGWLFNF